MHKGNSRDNRNSRPSSASRIDRPNQTGSGNGTPTNITATSLSGTNSRRNLNNIPGSSENIKGNTFHIPYPCINII